MTIGIHIKNYIDAHPNASRQAMTADMLRYLAEELRKDAAETSVTVCVEAGARLELNVGIALFRLSGVFTEDAEQFEKAAAMLDTEPGLPCRLRRVPL